MLRRSTRVGKRSNSRRRKGSLSRRRLVRRREREREEVRKGSPSTGR